MYSTEIRPTASAMALLGVACKVMDDLLILMPSHGRQNHLGKTGKGSETIEGWLTQLGSQSELQGSSTSQHLSNKNKSY